MPAGEWLDGFACLDLNPECPLPHTPLGRLCNYWGQFEGSMFWVCRPHPELKGIVQRWFGIDVRSMAVVNLFPEVSG